MEDIKSVENLQIVCSIKQAQARAVVPESESIFDANVFIFWTGISFVGKMVHQFRGDESLGTWEVLEQNGSKMVLVCRGSKDSLDHQDSLFAEFEVPKAEVPMSNIEQVLVFSGKNWKLASEKKWVEARLDISGHAKVGEVSIRGVAHTVYKLEDCFAAKPARVVNPDTVEHGDVTPNVPPPKPRTRVD